MEYLSLCIFRRELLFILPDVGNYCGQCSGKEFSSSLSTLHLGFRVLCLVFPHILHITLFCLMDIPHSVIGAQMVSFIVCFFGMCISFFRRFQFPLILRPRLTIFLTLVIYFSISVSLLVFFSIFFLILRSSLGGIGYLEVIIIYFISYRVQCYHLLLFFICSFILDRSPCTHSMLIAGWWSSNIRTECIVILYYVSIMRLMCCVISHAVSSFRSSPTYPSLLLPPTLPCLLTPPPAPLHLLGISPPVTTIYNTPRPPVSAPSTFRVPESSTSQFTARPCSASLRYNLLYI